MRSVILATCCLAVSIAFATADYTPNKTAGVCAMVGSNCGTSPSSAEQTCVSNTPAIRGNAGFVCPHLANTNHVCCDHTQLAILQQQFDQLTPLFGRCPACLNNFRTLWCEFTCSPNQSLFVDVTSVNPGINGSQVVNGATFSLSPAWAEQWYESCDNVQFGATGVSVFYQVFGAQNYEQVFEFIGRSQPIGYAPFQIDFAYPPAPTPNAMSDTSVLESCGNSCMCSDCPASCPNLTPVPGPGMCAMYGTCAAEPTDTYQNCVNNSFAQPAQANVTSICPNLNVESVCCDANQFHQLAGYVNLLTEVFGSCPACLSNLVNFYCQLTCSPDQSVYMDVQHAVRGTKGLPVVSQVQYRLDPNYAEQLWTSCAQVTMSNGGGNSMKVLYNAANLEDFLIALALAPPVNRWGFSIIAPVQVANSVNTTVLPIMPCAGNCPEGQCVAESEEF